MAPRVKAKRKYTRRKAKITKPTLIKVGRHFISPEDIRCISEVKGGRLYIIKFYSEPNPEYPCFVEPKDIGIILDNFNIVVGD